MRFRMLAVLPTVALTSVAALSTASAQATAKATQQAKPAGSAALQAAVAREQSVYDALTKKDAAAFNKALGSDFTYVQSSGAMMWKLSGSADVIKDCTTGKWTISDAAIDQPSP